MKCFIVFLALVLMSSNTLGQATGREPAERSREPRNSNELIPNNIRNQAVLQQEVPRNGWASDERRETPWVVNEVRDTGNGIPVRMLPPGLARIPSREQPNAEQLQLRRQYLELRQKVRNEKDEDERELLARKLSDLMEAMFDLDFEQREKRLEKLEAQVAKLRASQEKRKDQRDRIVNAKIEQLLLEADGLGFPDGDQRIPAVDVPPNGHPFAVPIRAVRDGGWQQLGPADQKPRLANGPPVELKSVPEIQLLSDEKNRGVRTVRAQVTYVKAEQRTREVPYTANVPQTRTRMVDGQRQLYTINVAEQRSRTETYTVQVPQQEEVVVDVREGENWEDAVRKTLNLPLDAPDRVRRGRGRPIGRDGY